ncbi:HD domain-containing protein [Paucibacter sp. TC2R-5]|uniref:HD domain-containing phosphohydrolase n=1 Tax=Paucibacter sp. TC2R-5 TaxID=2893555 RepID=UPI0021E3D397|nr:HD domain-containing phosphohydrolase [Paucibacter sp. TC2R-5]MCV2357443.1 HD domain-containing protein [Paucibacter sp. TC2R-5]
MNPSLFATETELAALERELAASSTDNDRLPALVALAWQLRQRESRRALALLEQAEPLQPLAESPATRCLSSWLARIKLVRGELCWLCADFTQAQQFADQAQAAFDALSDAVGQGDARLLGANIAHMLGHGEQRDTCLAQALSAFERSGDGSRIDYCGARQILMLSMRDPQSARLQLAQRFDASQPLSDIALAMVEATRGVIAALTGDFPSAFHSYVAGHQLALETGQLRDAILGASNVAVTFSNLGDLSEALEWAEQAAALARRTDWPVVVGNTLFRVGDIQRLLGRQQDAQASLAEAQAVMRVVRNSHGTLLNLQALGDLALDMGKPAQAAEYFAESVERAQASRAGDLVVYGHRGLADALNRLGRVPEALAAAKLGLKDAQQLGIVLEQVKCLRILAAIHKQQNLAEPEGMVAANPSLHYLQLALHLSSQVEGLLPSADLFDELAQAHADCGDFKTAYEQACSAAAARGKKSTQDANNRAIAMQIREETLRAQAEVEHHRITAQAEAQRAESLHESALTLEILGQVGREITACMNVDQVCSTLYRHVNDLLNASSFFVFLLDDSGQQLSGAYFIEDGRSMDLQDRPLDHPTSYIARCARERQELLVDIDPDSVPVNLIPGSQNQLTLLFGPLLMGERLLGVMSIQSLERHAYGERERSIFRTLCAYASIAIDNAQAYAEVTAAKLKLDDRAAWLADEVSKATAESLKREREAVFHLCKAAEYRDPETGAHILRMAHFSKVIAAGLKLSEAEQDLLLQAAPMHDIGKVGIADNILLKPGRLTPDEFEIMKRHAEFGHEILRASSSPVLLAGALIAITHHEKFDGSGYPKGLMGEAIPIFGRIVAVADVFDALTSERPYKKAWSLEDAAAFIRAQSGAHFDPACVEQFFAHWDQILEIRQRFKDAD